MPTNRKDFLKIVLGTLFLLLPRVAMAAEQKVDLPSPKDILLLAKHRTVVERLLAPADLNTKYKTGVGKLGALRAIIAAGVYKANQTYELQSMGVVLGDAFVLDMGFHWVIVEDTYGRDFALKYKDTAVIIFPLTMISKRVERGEEVDVFDLYNGVADSVQGILDKVPDKRVEQRIFGPRASTS
jgi:hypothetical protein